MRTERPANSLLLLFTLSLASTWTACGTGSGDAATTLQEAEEQSTLLPMALNSHVGITELNCLRNNFQQGIHHGTTASHQPITAAPGQLLQVGALQELVDQQDCSGQGEETTGILVHAGLDEDSNFVAMMQVLCLEYDAQKKTYTYQDQEPGYLFNASGVPVPDMLALSHWYGVDGPGARYKQLVVLARSTTGDWETYSEGNDVSQVLFPYQRCLVAMIADNQLGAEALIELEPSAEYHEEGTQAGGVPFKDTHQQGFIWVPLEVTIDDVATQGRPFLAKAANLGAPCPFTCPHVDFLFPNKGKYGCDL